MSAFPTIIFYFVGNIISYKCGVCNKNEFAYGIANAVGIVLALYLTGHIR